MRGVLISSYKWHLNIGIMNLTTTNRPGNDIIFLTFCNQHIANTVPLMKHSLLIPTNFGASFVKSIVC